MPSLLGPALAIAGFFLPWVAGAGVLDGRVFSGLDLALALRRYDLVADNGWALVISLALYAVPAMSVAGLVLALLAPGEGLAAARVGWLTALPSVYTGIIAILITLGLTLSSSPLLSAQPQHGLLLVLAGSVLSLLLTAGWWLSRQAAGDRASVV